MNSLRQLLSTMRIPENIPVVSRSYFAASSADWSLTTSPYLH